MDLSVWQADLGAVKQELLGKRDAVAAARQEVQQHESAIDAIKKQKDRLELAVGLASEATKGATASVKRAQALALPNLSFVESSLQEAQSAEQSANELLAEFNRVGAISLTEKLLVKSQKSLKGAQSDEREMLGKLQALQAKFESEWGAHGLSLYNAAVERLKPTTEALEAETATVLATARPCQPGSANIAHPERTAAHACATSNG